jgi:hypothetical protein
MYSILWFPGFDILFFILHGTGWSTRKVLECRYKKGKVLIYKSSSSLHWFHGSRQLLIASILLFLRECLLLYNNSTFFIRLKIEWDDGHIKWSSIKIISRDYWAHREDSILDEVTWDVNDSTFMNFIESQTQM